MKLDAAHKPLQHVQRKANVPHTADISQGAVLRNRVKLPSEQRADAAFQQGHTLQTCHTKLPI